MIRAPMTHQLNRTGQRCRLAALACLLSAVLISPAAAKQAPAAAPQQQAAAPASAQTAAAAQTQQTYGPSNVTIHAVRINTPITVDGRLDEEVYANIPPITDFIQSQPKQGAPNTERTEAWVMYDDNNIYIACRCWTTEPDKIVANDMRRDSSNLSQHDHFAVGFDTMYDGSTRSGASAAGTAWRSAPH